MANQRLFARAVVSVLFLASSFSFSGVAWSDQCEVVNTDLAKWAQKVVTVGSSFIRWCEPCNEAPSPPFAVKKIEARRWTGDKSSWTVWINGASIDLAYLFVQTGPATYANVGLLVGCGATGVSSFIGPDGSSAGPRPQQPPPPPSGKGGGNLAATTWQPIGVKECDDFFTKYLACIQDHFPAESRDEVVKAILQARDGLVQAMGTPEGKKALVNACIQMNDSTRSAVSSLGCSW
jgi:hypothetical protein